VPKVEEKTAGGVSPEIRELLARMRTDLDAFSDLEANALMYAGYQTAGEYVAKLPWARKGQREDWAFFAVEKMMTGEDAAGRARLMEHMRAGARRGGKWLQLSRNARRLGIGLMAILLGLIAAAIFGQERIFRGAVIFLCAFFAILVGAAFGLQYWRRHRIAPDNRPALTQIVFDLLVLTVGWLAAWIDLTVVRPAYLKLGAVEPPRLPPPPFSGCPEGAPIGNHDG